MSYAHTSYHAGLVIIRFYFFLSFFPIPISSASLYYMLMMQTKCIAVCIFDSWCIPVEPGCEVGHLKFHILCCPGLCELRLRHTICPFVDTFECCWFRIESSSVVHWWVHIERPERERLETRRVKNIQLGDLKLLYILLKRYSLCCERIAVSVVVSVWFPDSLQSREPVRLLSRDFIRKSNG